jgi:hypothetical protein
MSGGPAELCVMGPLGVDVLLDLHVLGPRSNGIVQAVVEAGCGIQPGGARVVVNRSGPGHPSRGRFRVVREKLAFVLLTIGDHTAAVLIDVLELVTDLSHDRGKREFVGRELTDEVVTDPDETVVRTVRSLPLSRCRAISPMPCCRSPRLKRATHIRHSTR